MDGEGAVVTICHECKGEKYVYYHLTGDRGLCPTCRGMGGWGEEVDEAIRRIDQKLDVILEEIQGYKAKTSKDKDEKKEQS